MRLVASERPRRRRRKLIYILLHLPEISIKQIPFFFYFYHCNNIFNSRLLKFKIKLNYLRAVTVPLVGIVDVVSIYR